MSLCDLHMILEIEKYCGVKIRDNELLSLSDIMYLLFKGPLKSHYKIMAMKKFFKKHGCVKIEEKSILYQKPPYLVDAGSHHPENSTDDREASIRQGPLNVHSKAIKTSLLKLLTGRLEHCGTQP